MSTEVQLITLRQTPERELHAKGELDKYKLPYRVHRFERKSPGWKGCIDSHLKVFEYGKSIKARMLWICEDNIKNSSTEFNLFEYQRLVDYLSTHDDWEIVFTGGYIHRAWDLCIETKFPGLYETHNTNHGSVSYFVHEKTYRHILMLHSLQPISQHYDHFLNQFKTHIFNPLFFYHAHHLDSNINQHSDKWRRVWFHPTTMRAHTLIFFHQEFLYLAILLGVIFYLLRKKK
jgi:hypothetical protein